MGLSVQFGWLSAINAVIADRAQSVLYTYGPDRQTQASFGRINFDLGSGAEGAKQWNKLARSLCQAPAALLEYVPPVSQVDADLRACTRLIYATTNESQAQALVKLGIAPEQIGQKLMPGMNAGVVRSAPRLGSSFNSRPGAEWRLSEILGAGRPLPMEDAILINWLRYPARQAELNGTSLLRFPDQFDDEIKARIWVLDLTPRPDSGGFHTPLNLQGPAWSLAQIRLASLNSLLHRQFLVEFSSLSAAFLVGILATLLIVLVTKLHRQGKPIFALSLMVWLLCYGLALWFANTLLPMAEGIVAGSCIYLIRRDKLRRLDKIHLQSALAKIQESQDRLQLIPPLTDPQERWTHVVDFARKVLHIESLAVLYAPNNLATTLKVADWPGLEQELFDVRPDLRLPPFNEAAERDHVKQMSSPVLPDTGAEQFVYCIRQANAVMGFILFSTAEKLTPMRTAAIEYLAQDVGGFIPRFSQNVHRLESPLPSDTGQLIPKVLEDLNHLGRELLDVQRERDLTHSGHLIYDIYGELRFANQSAGRIMQRLGITLYGRTVYQLLTEAIGSEGGGVERIYSRVVLKQRPVEVPLGLKDKHQPLYQMRISPIVEGQESRATLLRSVGVLRGLFVEILQIEEFWRESQFRLTLVASYLQQLRLAWVNAQLAAVMEEPPEHVSRFFLEMDDTLRLAEVGAHESAMMMADEFRPVNLSVLLDDVFALIQGSSEEQGLQLVFPRIRGVSLILSDHALVHDGLHELLEILIETSFADSQLNVRLFCPIGTEGVERLGLHIISKGAGFNGSDFEAALKGELVSGVASLSALQTASELLRDSNVEIAGKTGVGQGCELELRFQLARSSSAQIYCDFR